MTLSSIFPRRTDGVVVSGLAFKNGTRWFGPSAGGKDLYVAVHTSLSEFTRAMRKKYP